MAFTVAGNIRKRKYTIVWEGPEKISGDRLAVDLVTIASKSSYGIKGPVGMYFESDYLKDPLAALSLIESVFTQVDTITGDVPEAPIEEGAIM
jgi:hypothetical protein